MRRALSALGALALALASCSSADPQPVAVPDAGPPAPTAMHRDVILDPLWSGDDHVVDVMHGIELWMRAVGVEVDFRFGELDMTQALTETISIARVQGTSDPRCKFDSPNFIAQTWWNTDTKSALICFDATYTGRWIQVAAHEFGHSFFLGHDVAGTIMAPTDSDLAPGVTCRDVAQFDSIWHTTTPCTGITE